MSIFRAYDIRGVYPSEINGRIAYKIGLAFGKFIKNGTIAIGHDIRKSSPEIKENLLKGLLESGLNVIDIGLVPTPLLYFTVAYNKLDGGAIVTGSHNPKEYNGIKLCGKNGVCYSYETGIKQIEEMVNKNVFGKKDGGNFKKINEDEKYINFITKKVKIRKRLKVVIDGGNGVAGQLASKIFKKLGCEVISIFCEPDGDFPNHHPDPLVRENLKHLQEKVKETGADIGIAYDGDGDRVGFVDEKGKILENNKAFAFFIINVLRKNKNAKIVHEILASNLVEDVIKANGGVSILSKVGHSYIQKLMLDENCILGGETSGHYYFRENFSYDDGIFASVKLVEILSNTDKTISQLSAELPKYFTSDDTRIKCPDKNKFEIVERLKEKFKDKGKMITLDGVKVITKDWWFIVRASNTQPVLVLRWEAKDKKMFEYIGKFLRKEVENEIKKFAN